MKTKISKYKVNPKLNPHERQTPIRALTSNYLRAYPCLSLHPYLKVVSHGFDIRLVGKKCQSPSLNP